MNTHFTPTPDYKLITLAEAKRQLRIDTDFDDPEYDPQIESWIDAAVAAAEAYTEREIVEGVLTVSQDVFKRAVCFPDWRPLSKAAVSVTYVPFGQTEPIDLEADAFGLSKWNGEHQVYFLTPFEVADVENAIVITVQCKVPADVKYACLLKLADFDTFREDRSAFDNGNFEKLLRPYRKY